ncbi:MAG: EFR1 family ferrodoxin [Candidatus Amulumruptor caecigallinarius]|nr:EFR1 family ferrodoxin [Candidatus Amulumruptor caecigallinarius]
MILYFSGTGNSKHVARSLANLLDDDAVYMPSWSPESLSPAKHRLCFVFPVYSWGVPPMVLDYISKLSDSFVRRAIGDAIPVCMVCTCGDDAGKADVMLRKALNRRGLILSGVWSVIMPNTYVLLPGFNTDSQKVTDKKLRESEQKIREIASCIAAEKWRTDIKRGAAAWLKTWIVYPLFMKFAMNPRKWRATQECVRCGRCVSFCPVRNITMHPYGPSWGHNCMSCLSCWHKCPANAIAYGRITSSKSQYHCPLRPLHHIAGE